MLTCLPGQQGWEAIWTKGTLTHPTPEPAETGKAIQDLLRDLYLRGLTLEGGILK